jgi:hypothetical protein
LRNKQKQQNLGILLAATGVPSSYANAAQPLTRSAIPCREHIHRLFTRVKALCITMLFTVRRWLGGRREWYEEIEHEVIQFMCRSGGREKGRMYAYGISGRERQHTKDRLWR